MGDTPVKKPSRQPHQKGKSVYFNINLADERYIWEYFQNSSLKFSDVAKRLILEKLLKGESLESYNFPLSKGIQPNATINASPVYNTQKQIIEEQKNPAPEPTEILPIKDTITTDNNNNENKVVIKVAGKEIEAKEEQTPPPDRSRGRGSAAAFASSFARASEVKIDNN